MEEIVGIIEEDNSEVDFEAINRDFKEKPSDEVVLLAVHSARPDGFAKMLIAGVLATSQEISEKVGLKYVRTHRGYYWRNPPIFGDGLNRDLSFKVGLPYRDYAQSSNAIVEAKPGGLGVVFVASKILAKDQARVSYGNLDLPALLEKIKETGVKPQDIIRKLTAMTDIELYDYEIHPPKSDLLALVDLARQNGFLHEGDQTEVNIEASGNALPRLSLAEGIVLIPAVKKEAFRRLLKIKIAESRKFADSINSTFGVNVRNLTVDDVLDKLNIYWYPQKDITLAVKYLTTHPEKVKSFV